MAVNSIRAQNIFNVPVSGAVNGVSKTTGVLGAECSSIFSLSENSENAENAETENNMDVIAHRGYSVDAPENTIAAFVAAAENGYNTIECDIEWSKDSVPVLLHDSTINRTARNQDGSKILFPKKCSSLNYNELLQYDFGSWCGKEYAGTKIPTFYELMDCAKEHDLNLYIELKKTKDFNQNKAQILVDAVKEAGLEDKVTWISFEEDYLKLICELVPDARLGYLSDNKVSSKTIKTLENLNTGENEVFLDVKSSKMSEKASRTLQGAGFDFEVWGVEDPCLLDDLYSYDCKGITTDTITEDVLAEYLNPDS